MSKFKVGDKVRAITNCDLDGFRKGQCGVVEGFNSSGTPKVRFENNGVYEAFNRELELIEENEMSNENELRFGHRVICWNNDEPQQVKGRYISFEGDEHYPHHVLQDGKDQPYAFDHAKLDPEATEFLPGDVVEYSKKEITGWNKAKYVGPYENQHIVMRDGYVVRADAVRYPQPEPTLKDQLDKAIEGGARCVLMNENIVSGWVKLKITDEGFTNYTYKDIPVAITNNIKTFEVIK